MRFPRIGVWGKRLLLLTASLALAFTLLELLVPLGFRIVRGLPFPRARTQRQLAEQAISSDESSQSGTPQFVQHPYLGFTYNLDRIDHAADSPLMGYTLPWMKRGPDHLVVALVGGSFALQTGSQAGEELTRGLAEMSGRRIRLVNLGLGGYKQPQQLMTLTYLLSLGAEFDLVINIDGFNEIALPAAEMVPEGVFPLYPRDWYVRAASLNLSEIRFIGRIETLGNLRRRWARIFDVPLVSASDAALTVWKSVDRLFESRILNLTAAFRADGAANSWGVSGPHMEFPDDDALMAFLAGAWARCSLQMDRLCRANGARYVHVLQPNQYVPDSKPLSAEERAIAVSGNHPYQRPVAEGYSYLSRWGRQLVERGVEFHDFSLVFRDVHRILYSDNCCHLNKEGYRLIVQKLLDVLDRGGGLKLPTSAATAGTDARNERP